MLSNPAEIVTRSKKNDKIYTGRVFVYGYDTKSIGNMVEYLAKKDNIVGVNVNYGDSNVE